jgi:uncharacterized protein (DUF3084 family)
MAGLSLPRHNANAPIPPATRINVSTTARGPVLDLWALTPPPEQFTASINALKESVAGLEGSRKQLSDEVADLKRQLGTEQGERKMLAEQLGSLSSRIDTLAASLASREESFRSVATRDSDDVAQRAVTLGHRPSFIIDNCVRLLVDDHQ